MSQSHPRPGHARHSKQRVSGARIVGAGALVIAAATVVPWLIRQLTASTVPPVLAAYVALSGALYVWCRQVQQLSNRTAIGLSLVYAAIGAGAIWLWS